MRPLIQLSILLTFIMVCTFIRYKKLTNQLENETIIINLSSKSHQGAKNIEQKIRDAMGTRRVSDHISDNSIRLNWHSYNSVAKRLTAIIIVISTPESKMERMTIRQTWYNFCDESKVKIVFFMGLPKNGEARSIFLESALYDDIVMDNFTEDFYKVSIKVLRMFKWFMEFYNDPKATPQYLIKVDQDVFLHVPNIIQQLESMDLKPNEYYIGGLLHVNSTVTRRIKSKFYVPFDFYNSFKYPPYLGGSCYILSANLVSKIYHASFKVPLFHIEDVYISGMIAHQALGIKLHGLSRLQMIESSKTLLHAMKYKNNIWQCISYHGVDPALMKYLYNIASRHLNINQPEKPQ